MLKRQIRDAWADALESGKYKQGKCHLHAKGKYCCLGVLCEVGGIQKRKKANGEDIFEYNFPGETAEFQPWIDDDVPYNILGLEAAQCGEFAKMNDGLDKTFIEIAAEARKLEVED